MSDDPIETDDLAALLHAEAPAGECTYPCPFCAGATLLRQVRPEVAEHLSAAGREFVLAARAFFESLTERQEPGEGSDSGLRVRNIPLD